MSVTKVEVPDQFKVNNVQLIASFKELFKDTAGQIKRSNDTSAELPMKETKELKFREPLKFKRTASEDQYKFKLAETFDSAKSAAKKTNLENVKSDLEECEKLLVEQQNVFFLLTSLNTAVERPSIGMPAAQRLQSSPGSQLQSDYMSRIYLV